MRHTVRLPELSAKRVLELVTRIYDASMDPECLGEILRSIAEATDSHVGAIFVQDLNGQRGKYTCSYGIDPVLVSEYEYHSQHNVFMARAACDLVSGAVLRGNQYIDDDEYKNTLYYNDYMRRLGVFYTVGCCIYREETLTAILTFARRPGRPAYTEKDLALLSELMPHVQRCISIQRRLTGLESALAASRAALDQVDQAVLLLDEKGRPQHFNALAKEILDGNDGLSLHPYGLRPGLASERATLRRLVREATLTAVGRGVSGGGWMTVARLSMKRPYGLLVSPLPAPVVSGTSRSSCVVVLIWDPETTRAVPDAVLTQAYGLTPAEARIARLLLQGLDPRTCSEMLGVSIETVRTQMKRVFFKTRTHGQSDLIRVLLSGPARTRADSTEPGSGHPAKLP
jgi:DNA-binding CsgD family transcriptional regulator/PAS domain-containing protein